MPRDPRPLVYSRRCDTCVFHPGNRMRLQPGRLADIVATNRQRGTLLVCHQTTYGQRTQEVVCRGYMDAYGAETNVVRVMQRLATLNGYATAFRQVDPDDEEDPDAESGTIPG